MAIIMITKHKMLKSLYYEMAHMSFRQAKDKTQISHINIRPAEPFSATSLINSIKQEQKT